jgi:hypothetical protein
MALGQLLPRAPRPPAQPCVFELQLAQAEQVVRGDEQLLVVPGLGQIVARPLLDELHRRLQRGPGRDQQHRQPGIELLDRAEESHPLLAARGLRAEIHVLDHHPDLLGVRIRFQDAERLRRIARQDRGHAADLEQDLEGGGHGGLVFDDEDLGHGVLFISRLSRRN